MNLLTVDHITKVYTQRELFHDASFYLQDGEKVGIIGINGTGKSTLLKIMAGLEEPDAGNVVRANHLVIRYLPQMPEFDPQKGALENVLSYAQIGSVHQQEDREEHEKWNLESNAKSMMTRLGIYNFENRWDICPADSGNDWLLLQCSLLRVMYCFWMSRRTIWMPKWQSGWKII